MEQWIIRSSLEELLGNVDVKRMNTCRFLSLIESGIELMILMMTAKVSGWKE